MITSARKATPMSTSTSKLWAVFSFCQFHFHYCLLSEEFIQHGLYRDIYFVFFVIFLHVNYILFNLAHCSGAFDWCFSNSMKVGIISWHSLYWAFPFFVTFLWCFLLTCTFTLHTSKDILYFIIIFTDFVFLLLWGKLIFFCQYF